ncbi:type I pantothenate kinase [Gulosibacter bifidus]|uniref:Pantothenate kinase n=1 Tax=Gulosibacter bifidus TaxID=272239 RepID=A0ABW5RI24_9MICO|nr:type I pantothenate kinase [Gulosibacter bifidus]
MPQSGAQGTANGLSSPFIEIPRADWARLAPATPFTLEESDLARLRSLGDPTSIEQVRQVFAPLTKLINVHVNATRSLQQQRTKFLGEMQRPTPFVIGIAGSVAVGKSTVARLLRELLSRWEDTPRVTLVTTDGFLLPNAELHRRNIMHRKGFPESYDRRALLRFVTQVKSGAPEVTAPLYSHVVYDIVPGERVVVQSPDILIVEGLNVLQPPSSATALSLSDMFDFSIYVDARTQDIARWYEERFLKLQTSAFTQPESYFRRFANLSTQEGLEMARSIWDSINLPNLEQNVLPTRSRARLILRKAADHSIERILLRKL